MKCAEIGNLLQQVECRDLIFAVTQKNDYEPIILAVCALRPDAAAPPREDGIPNLPAQLKGREWIISEHATASEIIQTALAAALHFEEHEVREAFKYRGQAVMGPHFDVDDLVALAAVRGKAGARP